MAQIINPEHFSSKIITYFLLFIFTVIYFSITQLFLCIIHLFLIQFRYIFIHYVRYSRLINLVNLFYFNQLFYPNHFLFPIQKSHLFILVYLLFFISFCSISYNIHFYYFSYHSLQYSAAFFISILYQYL